MIKKILLWFLIPISLIFLYGLWSFSSFLFLVSKLPTFLDSDNTYLITLHNEGELRPNLGFLTGFILISHNGDDWKMEFHDSYDILAPVSLIKAPEILEDRFSNDIRYQGWTFRDSNFNLSYSENINQAIEFLSHDPRYSQKQIHTVISLDLHAIGQIIDTLGGINFEEKKITSHNLFETLELDSKQFNPITEEDWLKRKGSIKPLANSLIKKIILSPLKWNDINNTAVDMFNAQHILMQSFDSSIQKKIKERSWNGVRSISKEIIPYGINFANIGGKKGDRYTTRNINSLFKIDENGQISETLTVDIFHNGTRNLHSDRYFGYVQMVKPEGTKIESFDGEYLGRFTPEQKEAEYENTSQFDFFFQLDEGENTRFEIKFIYPKDTVITSTIAQSLQFIPQPGLLDTNFTFILQSFSDTRSRLLGCDAAIRVKENVSICNFENMPAYFSDGEKNNTIGLIIEPDVTPPLFEDIVYRDEGRKIRVQFSESLDSVSRDQIQFINKKTELSYPIASVSNDARAIEFEIETPLSDISRDFYIIKIDDLSDISGNTIPQYQRMVAYPKYKAN